MLRTAIVIVATMLLSAQSPTARWTELQRHHLPDIKRDGVEILIEIPPGVSTARHSHPGDDFGLVVEGTIVLMIDGKSPRTVKAGETFFTERGQLHNARNIGTTMARAVDTYIIDSGKPAVIPE